MSITRLYLIRHGENPANLTKEFSHHRVDYSLTARGVLQAEQTAERLAGLPIRAVYASPLKRAAETAAIIARRLNLPVQLLEEFREVNVGDLENRPPSAALWQIHNDVVDAWFHGHPEAAFPGGEDYPAVWRRYQSGLRLVVNAHPGEAVAIVGHGGLFALTIHQLCPAAQNQSLRQAENQNCSITEVEASLQNGEVTGRLVRWADFSHLYGEAARLVSGLPDESTFAEAG